MKKHIARFLLVAVAVFLGLATTACSSRRGHQHVHAPGGYYHYPHRPYHGHSHHVHYRGCGHGHSSVAYHYY